MFTIKYNRTTTHIDGIAIRSTGGGNDMGDHVSDYSLNACGALTRYTFAEGQTFESLKVALDIAEHSARKVCKTCKAAALAQIQAMEEAEIAAEEAAKGEGTMTEQTTTTDATEERSVETDTIEQIQANIERAASLVEAENVEGLTELQKETETLISSLPSRGRFEFNGKPESWAGIKKTLRGEWAAAAQPKPQEAPKAEVKKVTQGVVVEKTFDQYEGVKELLDQGAKKIAEGVKAHVKTSTLAKEVAALTMDMWLCIPNKQEIPDLMGASDQAKKASGELLRQAGNGFEDNYDNKTALKKLMRSVQDQRSDVRAEWLRSLDGDDEIAQQRRALVAKVIEGKPEDEPVSAWVANVYGASLLGTTERKRLEYQAKKEAKELESGAGAGGGEGEGEGEGEDAGTEEATPDERVQKIAKKLLTDLSHAKPEDFEAATEETKETVREELEKAMKALKAMIAATL